MPASWLVTRPPSPSSKKVKNAVSTANQKSHGFILVVAFVFMPKIKPPRHVVPGSCQLQKLFHLKCKIDRRVAVLDFHVLRLGTKLAVRGFHGVFAGRHILDDELAVLVADAKVRAVTHADPREHPRMHI